MAMASQIELPERYRVARHIASGGMASVWEAEDLLLGRIVAVKVLGAHYAADPDARERFQREARTAAQVSDQSHVVTIYDIGEHADEAFIVMEYFAGGTVADRLRAARDTRSPGDSHTSSPGGSQGTGGTGGPAPIARETALRWLREAAAGLDVAHAAGIVHRDVKPANLLLDAQGRLAVADFGIARLADDTQMTQTGQVLGTAAYISPEQARGQPATAASDRYALAVVAYELLTGSRPFRGGPPTAQALAHAESQPPPPSQASPGLPRALDAVLMRGLAKDPDARPATATELVAAIERALDTKAHVEPTRPFVVPLPVGTPEPAPTPPAAAAPRAIAPAAPRRDAPAAAPFRAAAPPAPPHRRRRPAAPALLGAALVAVAAVALVLVLSSGNDPGGAAQTPSSQKQAPDRARTATTPAQKQPAAAAAAGETPAQLNDRGFELIGQERYSEAIEPLKAAVAAYREAGERGLPFAFALYNLAVALNRSGDPAAAIPLLEERMQFENQLPKVRAELRDAQARLAAASGAGVKPGKRNGGKNDD